MAGEGKYLRKIVTDHQHGCSRFLEDPVEKGYDRRLALCINTRQRFVKKHEAGLGKEGPPQRHPLPLTAREGRRAASQERFYFKKAYDLVEAQAGASPGDALESIAEVPLHAQVWEKPPVLEDHAHPSQVRGDVYAGRPVEEDIVVDSNSSGMRRFQAR